MYSTIKDRLHKLSSNNLAQTLCGGLKGLEKESLRVNPEGKIAQTPHPIGLGSALTNPYITTDYSEALLEFITPPFSNTKDTLAFMASLHQFTYQQLSDELLWGASMPCVVDGELSIPIAQYGDSNIGKMKHIYRIGLWHRYGRSMQAIAGIHFNYSLPETFWPAYQQIENNTQNLQAFKSQRYMDMTRNLHRYGWLVLYLFGASPALCKSFLGDKAHTFDEFDEGTLYKAHSTSLRMSDIGYKNDSQSDVNVSYNNLEQYVSQLTNATQTPIDEYEQIGIRDDAGNYKQLNANILQIENEYYSNVRPKQIAESGESPSQTLKERGIKYVELRSVDLSIFEPTGTSEQQLYFLEAFMVFCLLSDSPTLSADEKRRVDNNLSVVASEGRNIDLKLHRCEGDISLKMWGLEIAEEMKDLCAILDAGDEQQPYTTSLKAQINKLKDADLTPSSKILAEMKAQGLPFFKFAMKQSQAHHHYFEQQKLSEAQQNFFERASKKSIEEQKQIELSDTDTFDSFLADYFAK